MNNIKIAKELIELSKELINETDYLYHATYKPLLSKIKKLGLGNTTKTFWNDSKQGVVYLADDPNIAQSYAEANENCPQEWLDEIVILKVKTKDLDQNKLFIDENVRTEDPNTFEYHSVIPFNLLKIHN